MSPVSSVESWFFSSLGWKVPMPTRSFSERTGADADVLHDLRPVAGVAIHELAEDEAARRVELPSTTDAVAVVAEAQVLDRLVAPRPRG
jgi:hypothetical protein